MAQKVTRGMRNKNPFNIKHNPKNKWLGLLPEQDGEFCKFSSLQLGVRAGLVLLRNYIVKGVNTPRLIIKRFAPATENHTDNYINFVSTFLDPDKVILYPSEDFVLLAIAILEYESLYIASRKYIYQLLNYYRL